ncbi:MAG: hypothetical protein SCARUB_01952 [Candidatus Scalindua rubra]|uniref:Uncharacterized protein n=1 Tax=Candidatus Scalindua rubra TaxID=1872076 RepID=A0A1E3XBB9_9BACT|nr:MAG: hypothetical protein SCARUB_01952 [Candidatus Scalindua rubra]
MSTYLRKHGLGCTTDRTFIRCIIFCRVPTDLTDIIINGLIIAQDVQDLLFSLSCHSCLI